MILRYGNITYFITILIPIALLLASYFIFKKRSEKTKKIFIYILLFINLIQHFFKAYIWWPVYHGSIDIIELTACNICATSIIIAPFIFMSKVSFLKDAIFYIGSIGGLMSICVPYFYENVDIWMNFDYLRFHFCHTVLLLTSALPVLWKMQIVKKRNCWLIALVYLGYEVLVFADNVLIKFLENGYDMNASYLAFYYSNPLWICHHPLAEDALGRVFVMLGLNSWTYNGDLTTIPVLWSALPVFAGLTLVSFLGNLLISLTIQSKTKLENIQ